MAKIGKNIVINGLRGKLRNLIIFRRQGNKTFTYLTPEKRTIPWSAAKKKNRRKNYSGGAVYVDRKILP